MLAEPDKDVIIAFAGIFQSSTLVYQLARMDQFHSDALHESSYSLFRTNTDSAAEVFCSARALGLGLDCIDKLFNARPDSSAREVWMYSNGMYQLSLKLRNNFHAMTAVEEGLNELSDRYLKNYHIPDKDNERRNNEMYEDIASLYARSISYMTPRIIVRGNHSDLSTAPVVNRIRTALFAGIRAAWLWHQLGGRRWKLAFHRLSYQRQAQELVKLELG